MDCDGVCRRPKTDEGIMLANMTVFGARKSKRLGLDLENICRARNCNRMSNDLRQAVGHTGVRVSIDPIGANQNFGGARKSEPTSLANQIAAQGISRIADRIGKRRSVRTTI